jgi:hypothetical protein
MNISVDICRPVRLYSFSTLFRTHDVLSDKLVRLVSFFPSLSRLYFLHHHHRTNTIPNIRMILFSILHYITNRRRQLMRIQEWEDT